MNSIIPIILIGMNRSGTKWLSNMLSNHIDVISLQNKRGGLSKLTCLIISPRHLVIFRFRTITSALLSAGVKPIFSSPLAWIRNCSMR